jgi:putative flavoprotein involved in K+ transport
MADSGRLQSTDLVEPGFAFTQLSRMNATPRPDPRPETYDAIVIGGGQAGLSVGYHLARRKLRFLILDREARIGDVWRKRWDSLRLFTPAQFDGLDGFPFPAAPGSFPTKDEMGDYLEEYARRFGLPVRTSTPVERLSRAGDHFVVTTPFEELHADQVIVAMSNYQRPRVPAYAAQLDLGIVQLHSSEYKNPSQLRPGPVLIVGAGNSGAEIARELAPTHEVWLAGRNTGEIPFRIDGALARLGFVRLVLRGLFHRVLTIRTPLGRKLRQKVIGQGGPLIRVKHRDLAGLGVRQAPRVAGVRDGRPQLATGEVLDVANVIWSVGFDPAMSWIDLPVIGPDGEPIHDAGVARDQPGLYFVGRHFLYAMSWVIIHGVGRDAERIAARVAATRAARATAA